MKGLNNILKILAGVIILFCFIFAFQLYISNPYLNSSFQTPFVAKIQNNQIILNQTNQIYVINNPIISFFRFAQGGIRIVIASFDNEKPILGSVQYIISQIHKERFDPSKPYVISAGHFSDFYLRNIGIFYNSVLDPCIPSSQIDWEKREKITTQTIALDLAVLKKVKTEPTTFSSIWPNVYVPLNIFTRPSDSLYSALYTLYSMQNPQKNTSSCHRLQTQQVGKKLLAENRTNLIRLFQQYQRDVLDQKTGLVKKDITLSSERDSVRRQSSFYDNVIFWATMKLANDLGLVNRPNDYFANLQNKIIDAFWDGKNRLFLNDLSKESQNQHIFSGDEFIVIQTHFLDINNSEDKKMLMQMISYVEKNKLDQPFPLRLAKHDDYKNLYFWVWFGAPMYAGESIWSHWGMEYIKALILTDDKDRAKKFLDIYSANIKKYGGYPEVYDKKGNILHSLLYKSLLHTGWVINYEEAKSILDNF